MDGGGTMAHPVSVVGGAHKAKKQGRSSETTPKTASKRQQLLASKAISWKEAETSQLAKEKIIRKPQADKGTPVETPTKTLKIILRRPGQQEPDPLAEKINRGTQEEEMEEEPSEHLQRRQKKSTVNQIGEQSGPEKHRTSTTRSEGPKTRKEPEPEQPEPVTGLLVQQAILVVQDTTIPMVQGPAIQLPTSLAQEEQPKLELPIEVSRPDRRLISAETGHNPEGAGKGGSAAGTNARQIAAPRDAKTSRAGKRGIAGKTNRATGN